MAVSLKKIQENFPYMEESNQKAIYAAIKRKAPLQTLDFLLENHGIEYIRNIDGEVVAKYSNSGDTYAPTVFSVDGKYRITSIGDFVETWERGKKKKLA